MRILSILFIFLFTFDASAQSRRVNPNSAPNQTATANPSDELTVQQLYDEAKNYFLNKLTEFEQKKVPYSAKLEQQTVREQKQLAAKNAAIASRRTNLAGEDFYYLGLLHWSSENMDGAAENFAKFAAIENPQTVKLQTARSVLAVVAARRKKFDEAEKLLADYLKVDAVKLSERALIETELAKSYYAAKNYEKAAAHAAESLRVKKALFQDSPSRAKGLDDLTDAGITVFKIYRDDAKIKEADSALEDLRKTAVFAGSPSMFAYAADKQIKYKIETGRKAEALQDHQNTLLAIAKDFPQKSLQADALERLRRRDKHYKLLGEKAIELTDIDKWFPGEAKTLGNLRGKVVFLDFWATWCMPCIEAFPHLIEWNEEFKKDGLEILGVTRYYGAQVGAANDAAEIAFLQNFRRKENLPYDLVVAKGQANQINYGANGIPTAVLIDRKGTIRYIESGTNPARIEEIRETIIKLLAEK